MRSKKISIFLAAHPIHRIDPRNIGWIFKEIFLLPQTPTIDQQYLHVYHEVIYVPR